MNDATPGITGWLFLNYRRDADSMNWPARPGLKQVDGLHLLDQRTQEHSVALRDTEPYTKTVDGVVNRAEPEEG